MRLIMVVAHDRNHCIGRNNDIPWNLPADLQHFKKVTMGGTLIMGRKTFDSIGRPLPGRETIVITRNVEKQKAEYAKKWPGKVVCVESLGAAIEYIYMCEQPGTDTLAAIVGGGEIYAQAIDLKGLQELYITEVDTVVENGDTYFPELRIGDWQIVESSLGEVDELNVYPCLYQKYVRINKPV